MHISRGAHALLPTCRTQTGPFDQCELTGLAPLLHQRHETVTNMSNTWGFGVTNSSISFALEGSDKEPVCLCFQG